MMNSMDSKNEAMLKPTLVNVGNIVLIKSCSSEVNSVICFTD